MHPRGGTPGSGTGASRRQRDDHRFQIQQQPVYGGPVTALPANYASQPSSAMPSPLQTYGAFPPTYLPTGTGQAVPGEGGPTDPVRPRPPAAPGQFFRPSGESFASPIVPTYATPNFVAPQSAARRRESMPEATSMPIGLDPHPPAPVPSATPPFAMSFGSSPAPGPSGMMYGGHSGDTAVPSRFAHRTSEPRLEQYGYLPPLGQAGMHMDAAYAQTRVPSLPDLTKRGADEAGPSRSRRSTMTSREDDAEVPGASTTGTGTNTGTEAPSPIGPSSRRGSMDQRQFAQPESSRRPSLPTPVREYQADEDEDEDEKMDHRKRKRNRTIRSCVPCHNHKRKCDRRRPCGRCTALGLTGTCVYEVDELRDLSDPTVAESERLRRRIAELEQVVRELRQKAPSRAPASSVQFPTPGTSASARIPEQPVLSVGIEPDSDNDKEQKKRRVIVDRFARFKIDEAAMQEVAAQAASISAESLSTTSPQGQVPFPLRATIELSPVDTAYQFSSEAPNSGVADGDGKGGPDDYRAEEYKTHLLPGEEMFADQTGRKTFLGVTSGRAMLRRLRELTGKGGGNDRSVDSDELLSIPDESLYSGAFADMRKTFPFTTIWSHENFSGEIIGLLPNRDQAEMLLQSFKDEACTFFLAWHQPTLDAEFRRFFAMSTLEKMQIPLSHLALYLMVCSLGCLFRAHKFEVFGEEGLTGHPPSTGHSVDPSEPNSARSSIPKDGKDLTSSRLQSELYLSGSYQALRLCSFMSSPTIKTIQTLILVNIYLINSERAADAWSSTGALIRQCVALGLHVDPASLDSKISMRDAEIKRRIWWTVAGLDALLCVSFGRPSAVNFYTTSLPQDRTDDTLSDQPGSAQTLLPPSNVIGNETTDATYHTAYFQLTIPSYELLHRVFRIDRRYSRSAIYGWFSPSRNEAAAAGDAAEASQHTYNGAVRLAQDIFTWYSHLPRGMRFEPDHDTAEAFLDQRSRVHIAQTLLLCVKTFMLVMVLHRPYLRADPSAYPESSEICFRAAHTILQAYHLAYRTSSSIFWMWWTVTYRAFQAGAVCAFLAIRQPDDPRAKKCLKDLRGTLAVFEGRLARRATTHSVQTDLCNGLVRLEKLATAATSQRVSSKPLAPDPSHLSVHWHPSDPTATSPTKPGSDYPFNPHTPLSEIRAFPDSPIPPSSPFGPNGNANASMMAELSPAVLGSMPVLNLPSGEGVGFQGDGAAAAQENLQLPQFWANVFGIKIDGDGQVAQ